MKKTRRKSAKNVPKTLENDLERRGPDVPMTSEQKGVQERMKLNYGHYALFFLLFVSLFASYKLILPYLNAIVLAFILAILLSPLYQLCVRRLRGRKNLAAFLVCSLLTLVVALPLIFMSLAIIQQGVQSFNAIYDWIAAGKYRTVIEHPLVDDVVRAVEEYLPDIQRFLPDFDLETLRLDKLLLEASSTVGKGLVEQGGHLLSNLTAIVGQFFLMLFAFFFFLRDQETIFNGILHLIPLSTSQEQQILDKVEAVAKSAILGTFVTALAQGFAGGIAFHIALLPGLFWGAMMAFASLIPVVGTALIWIPAAIWLFVSGHWGYGLFMTLWCAIVVGMIDNFVRPLFMKNSGSNMSTVLIFFSILGGLNRFGLIGLLYGPLLIGLTLVLLYMYSLEFDVFLKHQDHS